MVFNFPVNQYIINNREDIMENCNIEVYNCPCCGGEYALVVDSKPSPRQYMISCKSCSMRTEWSSDLEALVIDWNRGFMRINDIFLNIKTSRICKFQFIIPSVGVCCDAYSSSKRPDGRHWSHYPECDYKHCPIGNPELLEGSTLP